MDWTTLLSKKRHGSRQAADADESRTAFQRDFDRIVFSSAFRRLQDKTQVFPLARLDYVRTRLTHSLEAASVGRSLGALVGHALRQRDPALATVFEPAELGAIVASACLAHDIGNPPFGHAGEDAISDWFRHSAKGAALVAALRADGADPTEFEHFEGNAQGFRVLTRLMMPENPGARLTMATLGTFTKYPRRAGFPATGPAPGFSFKKYGVFDDDWPAFREVAETCGLPRLADGADCYGRHPLVYLVEAADDICYNIVDLEDGTKMGLLHPDESAALLQAVLGETPAATLDERYRRFPDSRMEVLRARTISLLVQQAVDAFIAHHDAIMDGSHSAALTDLIPAAAAFATITDTCRSRVYPDREVVLIEAAGFNVLGQLVERFTDALNAGAAANGKVKDIPPRDRAAYKLFPAQYYGGVGANPAALSRYQRTLAVTDFVSCMTDHYAVALFKRLTGISLPGE